MKGKSHGNNNNHFNNVIAQLMQKNINFLIKSTSSSILFYILNVILISVLLDVFFSLKYSNILTSTSQTGFKTLTYLQDL